MHRGKIILFIALLWVGIYNNAEAQLPQTEEPIDLGEIVVTASRMAQYDYKITGNVTVISREEIEASNAKNVPELLKQQLGVNVYDNNSLKTARIDIRGFGDTAAQNILVLVNDRRINAIDISGADLIQVPLEAIERIEVLRGAGSVLYGDNAVGGVVNIITKQGEGDLSGKVSALNGSYATSGTDMEVSGSKKFQWLGLPNDVSYYVYSKYYDTKGYRINSDLLIKDYSTRLAYKVSDKLTLDLNSGWHEDDQGLPGGLNDTELRTLGRRGSADQDDFASTKDRYVQLTLDAKPWPEDIYFGEFVLDLYYRNRDVFDAFFTFGESSTKRKIDTKGVTGKYIFDRILFNREVNFITGIDFYEHENDIRGSGSNPDDLTISKDEYGIFGYLQSETVDDVFLNGGLRFHSANYTFTQRNAVMNQEETPEEWVWMGGLKYEYREGSNIYTNVQKTFRFLSTDEWYSSANFPDFGISPGLNTNLKQQTGIQYEVGIKHSFDEKIVASVTSYVMDLKDEIFFNPVGFKNDNYEKTRRIGIESGADVDILKFWDIGFLDKLKFFTNYTYQIPRFKKGANDGKEIPFVPRYQVSSGLITGFFDHFEMSLISRFVGSRFAINDTLNATPSIKPYYVTDWKLSYNLKNFEFYVGVNNIFDEKYFVYVVKSAFSTTKDHFPAPERNYILGANLKF